MSLALNDTVKVARLNAVKAAIDAAQSAGKILLFSGERPAPGQAAAAPLVQINLTQPCGVIDATGLHIIAAAPAQASNDGLIAWARMTDGAGVWVFDCDVKQLSDTTAQAEITIDNAQVYAGGFINLISAVMQEA